MSRQSCKPSHASMERAGVTMCPSCYDHLHPKPKRDIMICESCGKGTDLDKAKVRRPVLENTLNKLKNLDSAEWQCAHCVEWNT